MKNHLLMLTSLIIDDDEEFADNLAGEPLPYQTNGSSSAAPPHSSIPLNSTTSKDYT